MNQDFKLSVVIPIYNTELYLKETIENVISQSLDFQKNIQLILVNDGSVDRSEEICKSYCTMYPDNVKYVDLERNRGVSAARNTGKRLAEGKYITFLDSDDLWSKNAFEEAVDFLEQHDGEIDFVSSNVTFFEASADDHILNINLEENAVIDMYERYSSIRTNCAACIFRTESVADIDFDVRQMYWEDAKYICRVLLKKKKYGMLADTRYYYRKRADNTSATQNFSKNISHYLKDVDCLFEDLYTEAEAQCGGFPGMLQTLMAYVLAYRFTDNIACPEAEMAEYKSSIRKIMGKVEDKYLCSAVNARKHIKLAMLSFKYECDISERLCCRGNAFYFQDTKVFDLEEEIISIWHIYSDDKGIWVEGRLSLDISQRYEIFALDEKGHQYPFVVTEWLGAVSRRALCEKVWTLKGYIVKIDHSDVERVRFILQMNGQKQVVPFSLMDKQTGKKVLSGEELDISDYRTKRKR